MLQTWAWLHLERLHCSVYTISKDVDSSNFLRVIDATKRCEATLCPLDPYLSNMTTPGNAYSSYPSLTAGLDN